ncbi:hypothetical protein J8I29_28560 [Labrys sp. LIt4]|uniref:hypothetical protein n=1 Tax=Labrys sp. LIt4 TaxID=2821355 RepID=UPI001ADFC81B|nr:hypothetical protein [Labrys sp. LIt4]MBP0583311.1 hypothetical protein [Labrys sp. LIt4]
MRRANQFWNRLVEIEHKYIETYRSLINENPKILAAQNQIDTLIKFRKKLETETKSTHDIHTVVVAKEQIQGVGKRINILSREVKSMRILAKKNNKNNIEINEINRKEAVRLIRKDSGVWWQTAEVAYLRYLDNRQRAMKGGTELRFRSLDADNIQIVNRNRRDLSLDEIFEGKGEFSLTPLPPNAFTHKSKGERRRLQRTQLTLCVYSRRRQPRLVTWPMQMHRPIPDNCTIKYVTVTRKKVGPRTEWKATFTCYCDPEPVLVTSPGATATVTFKPHYFGDCLRVAQVTSSTGDSEWITLPRRELTRFDYVGELIVAQCGARSDLRTALANLEWDNAPEHLQSLWAQIGDAPVSSRWLQRLIQAWPKNGWQDDRRLKFEERFRRDLRNWREITGLRLRLQRARLDHYRKAAHELVHRYGTIIVDDVPSRQCLDQSLRDIDNTKAKTEIRRLQQIAAPDILRQAIIMAARAHHCAIATSDTPPDDR